MSYPGDQARFNKLNELQWDRITRISPNSQLVINGYNPSDIYQGNLGNCYFLSSLSSISEWGSRVDRLFLQKNRSPNGAYCVALNICGIWREIIIDDFIPTFRGQIYFCHNSDGELWSMLCEKAYAKAYGGYWNIGTGGLSTNALMDITGAPTEFVNLKTEEVQQEAHRKIVEADLKHYVMNASTKGQGEAETSLGIVQGHA